MYLINQMRLKRIHTMTNNLLFYGKEMLVVYYYMLKYSLEVIQTVHDQDNYIHIW